MVFIPVYILILAFTIVIDYFAGIWIERAKKTNKKYFLVASLIANIGVLAIFKYYDFIIENLDELINFTGLDCRIPALSIILPIGLSFHTFQAMSYTIEVYRGNQLAEKRFGIYALYVMFYPQLVAGPIERPQNLIHQFYEKHKLNINRIVEGLKIMIWGFFMKLVVADRLAIYVNAVYNNPQHHSGQTLALATVFFAFQIYCDFAGYSNIAIGAANVMGFKLMTNFNRPYFSSSISEFWKRWHISLSTWFKDYLYISLGGNRVKVSRMYFNLFFVFLVSGLWHGASWTYVIWGAINGFYLIFALLTKNIRNRISHYLLTDRITYLRHFSSVALTFIFCCFAWIFFRAASIDDALLISFKIFSFNGPIYFGEWQQFFYAFLAIIILIIIEARLEFFSPGQFPFKSKHWLVEQLQYSFLIVMILLTGVFDGSQFIYFQF